MKTHGMYKWVKNMVDAFDKVGKFFGSPKCTGLPFFQTCKTTETQEGKIAKVRDDMMCAMGTHENNKMPVDACQGDTGGPLVCEESQGIPSLYGVVSWDYGCGKEDYP